MTEKTNQTARKNAVPTSKPASNVSGGQDWSPGDQAPTFVVVRDTYGIDMRVSDKEYRSIDDPRAIVERDFWNRVIKRYPDGTSVEVRPYDKRKHRVW